MNFFTITVFITFFLAIVACGMESPEKIDMKKKSAALGSEITPEGELPSIMTEGLTSEEKSMLAEEILPNASPDDLTPEEKFLKLRKDADSGDAKAQNTLGVMYFTGEAISKDETGKILKNDPAKAAAWFHRSALQGYANAQFNLGLMYANGEGGLEKDTVKAFELFRKAAAQGNADAQNNLGAMYHLGEGVTKDLIKAKEWYTKAAAQGNIDAQANLDTMK